MLDFLPNEIPNTKLRSSLPQRNHQFFYNFVISEGFPSPGVIDTLRSLLSAA
jgi:hypothetical protein